MWSPGCRVLSRSYKACLLGLPLLLVAGSLLGQTGYGSPQLTITTSSLPSGIVGQQYTAQQGTVQLTATGGSGGPYAWTYASFSSPNPSDMYDGLSFNNDGTITGTPTAAGTLTFLTQAYDPTTGESSNFTQFSITITTTTTTTTGCVSTISPSSPLPPGEVSIVYPGLDFIASGCQAPYTYTAMAQNPLLPNSFPPGLSVTSNGLFSGTPTAAGTFNIVVTSTDANQNQTQAQYTITINPLPTITTQSPLPNGTVSVAYSEQITATGGTPPYTFSMNGQPPGIVNVTPAGVLYGTPTTTGTYSFNIGVTDSLGAQTVSPFQVTFVTPVSQIQVAPLSLTFNANLNGNPPPAQAITVVPANGAPPPVNYTVVVDSGQTGTAAPPWITVTPPSGGAPAGLVVSVNPGTMAVGTYPARIQILDPIGVPNDVSVTLNVASAPQQLTVAPATLNFAALSSAPGTFTENLLVSNTGAAALGFDTSVVGNNSLISNVTSSASQTTPNAPVFLQVQVTTNGLQVGAYNDTILVSSSAGNIQVPVSLFVAANGPILAVSKTGILFQAVEGGGSTAKESIEVLNLGDPGSTVNWNASLVSGSNWLSLVSSSGTATSTTPSALTLALAPNATQLPAGPYYALVEIADSNSLNSPQYVTAVLNLQPGTAAPAPNLAPTGLFFTTAAGGSAPPSQQVQINTSSASPVAFAAAASTANNGTWLSVTPATGSASGQTSGSISVSVDPTGLAPGIYSGDVSVSIGASLQSVNITFVVPNSGSSSAGSSSTMSRLKPRQSGCTASQLAITETGLANNFAAPAGWPATLIVQLNDDCGALVTSGNVVASFSNGDAPLSLAGDTFGNYSATWQPGAVNADMVVTINSTAGTLRAATAQLFGGIAPNQTPPPTLVPGGTLNNLNPIVGAPLSPGTIVQVYGTGLARAAVSTGPAPLPKTFNDTYALVGPTQAPLYSLSGGQINMQIPFEAAANQQIPIVLSVNNALTLPITLNMIAAAPGVLSADDGPTPPNVQNGAHIIAQHSADGSLVTSASPAKPGEYLVIYLVGMGATQPSVPSGTQTPLSPLSYVTEQPTVTVGSQMSPIRFAGLTPGFVGLYQIDFQVPTNSSSGELEVDVTQNGIGANPTLLPVSN
jgi:uncharacterized protein (TIGR03437 family)